MHLYIIYVHIPPHLPLDPRPIVIITISCMFNLCSMISVISEISVIVSSSIMIIMSITIIIISISSSSSSSSSSSNSIIIVWSGMPLTSPLLGAAEKGRL